MSGMLDIGIKAVYKTLIAGVVMFNTIVVSIFNVTCESENFKS